MNRDTNAYLLGLQLHYLAVSRDVKKRIYKIREQLGEHTKSSLPH